jgi:ankyrin repeat protein
VVQENEDSGTKLIEAARNGHLDAAKNLLKQSDVNSTLDKVRQRQSCDVRACLAINIDHQD